MKLFHVFTPRQYYPEMALGDYYGSFETLEEAQAIPANDYRVILETLPDGSLGVAETAGGWEGVC